MIVRLWNYARIHSWNQPVLSNKGKVSGWRKQRGPRWGSNPRPAHYESDAQQGHCLKYMKLCYAEMAKDNFYSFEKYILFFVDWESLIILTRTTHVLPSIA